MDIQALTKKLWPGFSLMQEYRQPPYTEEMLIRDRYMGRRIGTLLQDNKDKRITHITGWQHLKDPHNVFTPFHPIKVFPYD